MPIVKCKADKTTTFLGVKVTPEGVYSDDPDFLLRCDSHPLFEVSEGGEPPAGEEIKDDDDDWDEDEDASPLDNYTSDD